MMAISIRALALALSGVIASAAFPAMAADMYRAPAEPAYVAVAGWTGFYAGVNGGYAFDSQGKHTKMFDEGGFGGGQIGYSWQGGFGLGPNVVLGVEADFQGAGIDHSIGVAWTNGHTGTHTRNIDDFGTVRGRLGYAAGPTLVYFTGGFAYGDKTNEIADTTANTVYKEDGIETGYVLGGGVEYKLNPSWSVKAEYQFIDLNHENATDAAGKSVTTVDTELSTVRMGVNYHFGSTYAPLK
jgi:outer membrane immunogenic protein